MSPRGRSEPHPGHRRRSTTTRPPRVRHAECAGSPGSCRARPAGGSGSSGNAPAPHGGHRQGSSIYKNNVDYHGASYGTHEGYLMRRAVPPDVLIEALKFPSSSPADLRGAGMVGAPMRTSRSSSSPARRFISVRCQRGHPPHRPLVNTRVTKPHATPSKYRRLHVIVGDANMSEWATAMKAGTPAWSSASWTTDGLRRSRSRPRRSIRTFPATSPFSGVVPRGRRRTLYGYRHPAPLSQRGQKTVNRRFRRRRLTLMMGARAGRPVRRHRARRRPDRLGRQARLLEQYMEARASAGATPSCRVWTWLTHAVTPNPASTTASRRARDAPPGQDRRIEAAMTARRKTPAPSSAASRSIPAPARSAAFGPTTAWLVLTSHASESACSEYATRAIPS